MIDSEIEARAIEGILADLAKLGIPVPTRLGQLRGLQFVTHLRSVVGTAAQHCGAPAGKVERPKAQTIGHEYGKTGGSGYAMSLRPGEPTAADRAESQRQLLDEMRDAAFPARRSLRPFRPDPDGDDGAA